MRYERYPITQLCALCLVVSIIPYILHFFLKTHLYTNIESSYTLFIYIVMERISPQFVLSCCLLSQWPYVGLDVPSSPKDITWACLGAPSGLPGETGLSWWAYRLTGHQSKSSSWSVRFFRSCMDPLKILQSTCPRMPDTRPQSVCCHMTQSPLYSSLFT